MIYKKRVVIVNDNDLSNDINNAQSAADSAVLEQHRIYYRSKVGETPHGAADPAEWPWITNNSDTYNETATGAAAYSWSTKITPIARSTSATTDQKYLFLYTCIQKRTVDGHIYHTQILLDDSTTVIDGGNIVTGTITSNQINSTEINASNMLTVGAFSSDAAKQILNSEIQLGCRNLLLKTGTPDTHTISLNSNNYHAYDCYKTYAPVPTLFETDDLVTVAFDWETNGTDGNFHIECGAVTPWTWGTVVNATGGRSATSNYVDITSTNQSGHFICTFKVTSAQVNAANTLQWLRIRVDGANMAGKTLTISNAQAERGNKVSDWSPAPEDLDVHKYITSIDSDRGITIKPLNTSDNNWIEINSTSIDFYRSGNSHLKLTNDSITVGQVGNANANKRNVYITNDVVQIRNNTTVLAEYGSTIKLNKPDGTAAATITGDGINMTAGSISLGAFTVTKEGKVTATSGTIGGYDITANSIQAQIDGSGNKVTAGLFWHFMSWGASNLAFGVGTRATTSDNWTWKFKVTHDGVLTATGADITGKIVASEGTIGGWTANSSYGLYTNSKTSATSTNTGILIQKDGGIYAGAYNSTYTACPFQVTSAGALTAISGRIGKFNLSNTYLYTGSGTTQAGMGGDQAFWAGSSTSNSAPFRVSYGGVLYATGATISGAITATSLTLSSGVTIAQSQVNGLTTALAGKAPSGAEQTATSYITNIDSNNGITIKPINTAGNDYIQINSTAIDFFHNGNSQLCIQDSWIAIGNQSSTRITLDARGTSPYIYMNTRGKDALRLDANGVTLYDETGVIGTQIKSGEIVLGAVTDYQTTITPDAFTMSHAQLGDLYSVELGEDETRKIDISSTVAKGKTKTGIKVAFTSSITVLYNWKGSGGQVTLGTYTTSEWGVGTTKTATGLTITRTAAQVFSIKNTGTTTVYVTFRMTTTAPGLHMHWSGDNNLLWSGGGWYMRTSQIAYLDEPVSSQLNGIVLVWGRFTGGNAVNAGWNCQYIPKGLISTMEGSEFDIMLVDGTTIGRKIVKVYDNRIEGGNDNNGTADVSGSGMTLHPASFVLRFVYGI